MNMVWRLLKETWSDWKEDKVPRLGAALAYYSIFAMAPLLIIAIRLVGIFYGQDAAQGHLSRQLDNVVGPKIAETLEGLVNNLNESEAAGVAMITSIAALVFGATGAVVALKDALNTVWGVTPDPTRGLKGTIIDRLLGLAIVVGVGGLLLATVVASTAIHAVSTYTEDWRLSIDPRFLNSMISLLVVTFLFAMLFKTLPDVRIRWRDLWPGALFTALLFLVGKELISFYLGRKSMTSTYGAAGSLVALLVWAYYSAQILLLGAEFTQVYTRLSGAKIEPRRGARRGTEFVRERDRMMRKHERMSASDEKSELRAD